MIGRRRFIAGAVLAATPLDATASAQEYKAQQAGKVYRIGLSRHVRDHECLGAVPARVARARLGGAEGKNIVTERRFSEGKQERFRDLAAELVRLNDDVMVASRTQATLATKNATTTIPIVMAAVGDPVGAGLVGSLARPGGNVTGLSLLNPATAGNELNC